MNWLNLSWPLPLYGRRMSFNPYTVWQKKCPSHKNHQNNQYEESKYQQQKQRINSISQTNIRTQQPNMFKSTDTFVAYRSVQRHGHQGLGLLLKCLRTAGCFCVPAASLPCALGFNRRFCLVEMRPFQAKWLG